MMLSTKSIENAINSPKAKTSDYTFLKKLEKRLHSTKEVRGSGAYSHRTSTVDEFAEEQLSTRELKKLFKIFNEGYFVFFPADGNFGFSPKYVVVDPLIHKSLLTLKDKQLPGQSFDSLSEYFLKPENVKKVHSLGVAIAEKSHYYY